MNPNNNNQGLGSKIQDPNQSTTTLPETEKSQVIPSIKTDTVVLSDGRIAKRPDDAHFNQQTQPIRQANQASNTDQLRVIPLGGQDKGGGANMIVIEYGDEAIITDVGHNLGIELPGVNYSIPNTAYLETIKHKIKAYVFTHGHLDHIGAVPHIVPKFPAPLYGSRFTVGMLHKEFDDENSVKYVPQTVVVNQDNHERIKIGKHFTIELVRVTHSIPECTCVVIDTPVGRIINTGDFRLDPEPLDLRPTDIERLKQLGQEGVLLLMSESTTTERLGRTPTESTLEPSFTDLLTRSKGRVIAASFSSNINRVQMIINASVKNGRRVAIIGRSMLAHVELAVKLGILKVPQGTILRSSEIVRLPDSQITIICTGGQGENFAALQRMSFGTDKNVKIKNTDTVIFSSTPIPFTGNDENIRVVVDGLMRQGAKVYRAHHHDIDGCGPLHVSGHASTDEFAEMIKMTNPKFLMPIYGDYQSRLRHITIAKEAGMQQQNCILSDHGDVLELTPTTFKMNQKVHAGEVMVDNTGQIVPGVVIKDRLSLMDGGMVIIILTMRAETGQLLTSPDVITRGFIQVDENQALMTEIRNAAKVFTAQNQKTYRNDGFKHDLRDFMSSFLYKKTKQSPLIIPVVNLINKDGQSNVRPKPTPDAAHN